MFSKLDKSLILFDTVIRGFQSTQLHAPSPATNIPEQPLNIQEKQQSISMMRINHSGEICAQALYQGQALTVRSPKHFLHLINSASEETNHLLWCKQRLDELNAKPSLLNPIWYAVSFGIGTCAGIAGDNISLGFIAETEHQVGAHLGKHLANLSKNDLKSKAILEQMRTDELNHAEAAENAGGIELPKAIKFLMSCTAKVLTLTAARI